MFLLNNPDLPATTESAIAKAPFLRVRTIANRPPFAVVGAYASYGLRPGFDAVSLNLPSPTHVGRYFQLTFNASTDENYNVSAVSLVSLNSQLYTILTDASAINGALPLQVWVNTQALNLYTPVTTCEGDTLTAHITVDEQIPIPDEDLNYTIDISEFIGSNSFTVSRVVSEGLTFSLAANPSNPQTGEFTQVAGTIKLYGAANYQPRALRPVQIEGVWQVSLRALIGTLVTFDLSSLGVSLVDELTYLGIVCRPARNLYALSLGDLLATLQFATCCVPYARSLWVRGASGRDRYTSSLGELSYSASAS
ncbi:MAG: hypothetical protein AAGB19_02845 [Cyanobacteria bacterium P01_F01_bin.3]